MNYNQKYYLNNKEAIKTKNKTYVQNNRESVSAYRTKWQKENINRYLLTRAKHRAKKKNLDFNLVLEDIKIPLICPVFGIKIEQSQIIPSNNSTVIDITDNTLG